ncbi:hypothetical protein EBZ37_13770, partial [bacterium]|nr:hypothetical protein [bacterium]
PFTVPAVPRFTPANTAAFSSVFSQCSGQALATMMGACGTSAEFDSELDLACESLSATTVATASIKINAAIEAQSCKKTQLSMARGKLDCVAKGASLLQAMIGQQRQQFEGEIQYAQSALRQLSQVKKGFEEQDEFIGKRLNGDRGESGSGAIGLIDAQALMEKSLEDMNGGGDKGTGTIAIFKKANRDIDDRKKALLEQVQARTVELTGDCITRGGSDGKRYQCVPNGPDVSYLEFLACQYERSFSIGEGGRIERDAVNKKRGEVNSASLMGALREIVASIPRSIKAPGNDQMDSYYKNVNSLWFKFDDFKEGIRSKLVGFDNAKFQVSDRVLKTAQACFGQARQQVAKERLGASSGGQGNGGGGKFLVDLQNEIKTSEEAQQSFARKF